MYTRRMSARAGLPAAVRDLAMRLGVLSGGDHRPVRLFQKGRMKRKLGSSSWMNFTARETISTKTCEFAWGARTGPFGLTYVREALKNGAARSDVTALGQIPITRTPHTETLASAELMRYLAELAWAPDAILANTSLRWWETGPDELIVGAGSGESAAEVTMTLDRDGRIATVFAPDRPRSVTEPTLPTPWRGRFWDYREHLGRWLPFASELAWEMEDGSEIYWQGTMKHWDIFIPGSARTNLSQHPKDVIRLN